MYFIWIMVIFLALYLLRLILGPSVWDRLLGMNLVSAKIVIIIAAFASLFDKTYYLDISLIYTLLGFVSVIFIAYFLLERTRREKEKRDNKEG